MTRLPSAAVDVVLQVAVSGLAAGALYGLVAVGHSLVYRLTGVVHFAFGELVGARRVRDAARRGRNRARDADERRRRAVRCSRSRSGLVVCVAAAGAGTYLLAVQPYLSRGSTIGWVGGDARGRVRRPRSADQAVFDRPSYVFPDPLPFREGRRRGLRDRRRRDDPGARAVRDRRRARARRRRRRGRSRGRAPAAACGRSPPTSRTARGSSASPSSGSSRLAFALAGGFAALAAVAAAPSAPFAVDTGVAARPQGARRRRRRGVPLAALDAVRRRARARRARGRRSRTPRWRPRPRPAYARLMPLAARSSLLAARPRRGAGGRRLSDRARSRPAHRRRRDAGARGAAARRAGRRPFVAVAALAPARPPSTRSTRPRGRPLPRARRDRPRARGRASAGCRRSRRARSWRVGAFAAALLRIHVGLPPLVAALGGAAAAAAVGAVTGVGARAGVRRGLVAVSTWILAWLVALALARVPVRLGGARRARRCRAALVDARRTTSSRSRSSRSPRSRYVALARGPVGIAPAAAHAAARRGRRRGRAGRAAARAGAFVARPRSAGSRAASRSTSSASPTRRRYGPVPLVQALRRRPDRRRLERAAGPRRGRLPRARDAARARRGRLRRRSSTARFHPVTRVGDRPARCSSSQGGSRARGAASAARGRGAAAGDRRWRSSPAASPPTLRARRPDEALRRRAALDGLDLDARAGDRSRAVGPNGSGKTTALRALAGTLVPDEGRVLLGDDDVTAEPVERRVERDRADAAGDGGVRRR